MRLLVTLLFFGALAVFLWLGLQYLMARFAKPLAQHRREHDQIQDRLSDLERRTQVPSEPERMRQERNAPPRS